MMPQSSEKKASVSTKTEKLENIERTVRNQVECEERAFHIVNKLIYDYVEGTYLVECAKFISKEHYNDIVEERAISHLCGYPVCANSLGKTPNKKYHVSTKSNKVYEISERKNFCSNQCFRASRHFSAQIPDSPLWMREKEQLPTISLLPQDRIKGIVGDEVIGSNPKQILKDDLDSLEELDKKTSTSQRTSSKPFKPLGHKQTENISESNIKRKEIEVSGMPPQEIEHSYDTHSDYAYIDSALNTSGSDDTASASLIIEDLVSNTNTNCGEEEAHNEYDLSVLSQKFDELRTNEIPQEKSVTNSSPPITLPKEAQTSLKETSVDNKNSERQESDEANSKMHLLKALLQKRKNMLSKMVDLRTVEQNSDLSTESWDHSSTDMGEQNSINDNSDDKISLPKSTEVSPELLNRTGQNNTKQPPHVGTSGKKSPLLHVYDILKTWVTPETALYLSRGLDRDSLQRFSDPQIQQDYGVLCHRLAAQEKRMDTMLDGSCDGDTAADKTLRPSKPVPDYKALKEETEALKLNVMEFITGKKQKPKEDQGLSADNNNGICLPTIDTYDQHQIRVRIVLDRLDKSLPDVLASLGLSVQDVSSPIRELVHTCRLEKDNIVLRPGEWTLAALLILNMLSMRYPRIESSFTSDSAIRHFSAVLLRLGHNFSDLHDFANDILQSSKTLSESIESGGLD